MSAPPLCHAAQGEVEPALDAGERSDLFWQRQRLVVMITSRRNAEVVVSWTDTSEGNGWVKVTKSPSFVWLGKFQEEDGSRQFNAAIESVPATQKVERCFTKKGKPVIGPIAAVISFPPFDKDILVAVDLDAKTGCGVLDFNDLKNPVIVHDDAWEAKK